MLLEILLLLVLVPNLPPPGCCEAFRRTGGERERERDRDRDREGECARGDRERDRDCGRNPLMLLPVAAVDRDGAAGCRRWATGD